MYGTGIIDLRQIAENEWRAKYQGNYGVYTIKIPTNGKKTVKFSCTCPSDYYPCKHIPIIEEAIAKKLVIKMKNKNHDEPCLDDFIKNVSVEKLREFITTQAKYNTEKYIDKKELFQYCLSEFRKEKNANIDFYNGFQQILGELAVIVDPDIYISLQDELFAGIKDKSSREAEIVLQRKINFYRNLGQKNKAWAIIKENLQIDSFRLTVVKKMIDKQKFRSAKKLINDLIKGRGKSVNRYFDSTWNGLLLDIAQKEEDIPAIKKISYMFIEDSFNEKYYQIYKTAFNHAEWDDEREKLFMRYSNEKYFNDSAADLLVIENDAERLVNYIEKHLSLGNLERYYEGFASDYPEKALEMFKKALIPYAENNTGRSFYEHILSVLKQMARIKGGKQIVSDLMTDFRIQYKNRRAMMEILNKF